MEDKIIETIIAKSIEIGVVSTLNKLGLQAEIITEVQAYKIYGKRLVSEWRGKKWVIGYPSGNAKRGKVYFKRSELEIASRMLDIQNIIPANRIFNN